MSKTPEEIAREVAEKNIEAHDGKFGVNDYQLRLKDGPRPLHFQWAPRDEVRSMASACQKWLADVILAAIHAYQDSCPLPSPVDDARLGDIDSALDQFESEKEIRGYEMSPPWEIEALAFVDGTGRRYGCVTAACTLLKHAYGMLTDQRRHIHFLHAVLRDPEGEAMREMLDRVRREAFAQGAEAQRARDSEAVLNECAIDAARLRYIGASQVENTPLVPHPDDAEK